MTFCVWNAFPEFLILSDCTGNFQRRCRLHIFNLPVVPCHLHTFRTVSHIALLRYYLALLAGQVFGPRVFHQCRDPNDIRYPVFSCPCGVNQVIRIHSAEVRLTNQCPLDVECTRSVTNHSAITRCDGHDSCLISENILNYDLSQDRSCGQHQKRNLIKVTYDCINGKLK